MQRKDSHIRRFILVIIFLTALSLAWKWGPLARLIDVDTLGGWIEIYRESAFAPIAVVLAYVVGGMIMFPVIALVVATVMTFDPFMAFIYGLLGCMASAMALFVIGQWLGGDSVQRIAGRHYARLSEQLKNRGWVVALTMRLFPIAPYTVVNLVAGASPLRFGDYVLGTFLGLTPWLILFCVMGKQIEEAISHPSPTNYLLAVVVVVLVILANIVTQKRLAAQKGPAETSGTTEEC
jgi:uncharacterized membrane protein YdjX (TVP38/TMEM64 family)